MVLKVDINKTGQALKDLSQTIYPSIGIDIDGVIDEGPIFFSFLSHNWRGKIFIISYRNDLDKAKGVLDKFNIYYDELVLVSSFEEKAKIINEKGISFFFDDQPEMLKDITSSCQVFLVRNEGNFDFDDQKWMLSNKTGKLV